MNPDIKGRILAHIMFEEMEKIAAKGSSLLKSLVTKNIDTPAGKIVKGLKRADLKPLNLDTLGRPPKVVPTGPKPSQYVEQAFAPPPPGFRPMMDFDNLAKVDNKRLTENFLAMSRDDHGYDAVRKEMQKRRNAVMKGSNRGPIQNIEQGALARGEARRRATTPTDVLGEPLDTASLSQAMAADASADAASAKAETRLADILAGKRKPKTPDEIVGKINKGEKQTKKIIKDTATPPPTRPATPTGGAKDSAQQILDIDGEIQKLEKQIKSVDTVFNTGKPKIDESMRQFSVKTDKQKIEMLKAERNALQNPSPEANAKAVSAIGGEIQRLEKQVANAEKFILSKNPKDSPVYQATFDNNQYGKKQIEALKARKSRIEGASTRASGKPATPKSGESNVVIDKLEEQINVRQQQLNQQAQQFIDPPGGKIDEAAYAQFIKDEGELKKARARLEKQRNANTTGSTATPATPPVSTPPATPATPTVTEATKNRLEAELARGSKPRPATTPASIMGGTTPTGSPPTRAPATPAAPPGSTKATRDVDTIIDEMQAQINAPVPNRGKIKALQSELKAANAGSPSPAGSPPTGTPSSTPPSIIGSTSAPPVATPIATPSAPPPVKNYENMTVNSLVGDANTTLPEGARETITKGNQVSGPSVAQMDPNDVDFLRKQGVIIEQGLDPIATQKYMRTADVKDLPAGELSTAGMSSDQTNQYLQNMGLYNDGRGLVMHGFSGKQVGTVDSTGKVILSDQKTIVEQAASSQAFSGNLDRVDTGVSVKMDNLIQEASAGGKDLNYLKELKQGSDTFLINSNTGAVVGKKQGGNVVGVDRQEVAMLEQRFEDTQRRDLLQKITPEGNNGLYTSEQITAMGSEQKRLIPYSEGGTGVQTIDDFKSLESQALDAERLFNEQLNAVPYSQRSAEFKKTLKDLENDKIALRERYRESRAKLQSDYQDLRRKQISGDAPNTNAEELEEALEYLKDKEVGFFNTTPLKNNTKGYKTPATPGSVLGDSAKMGLGIGAAGLGAYALLGGSGSGGSQQDPYAQYGQY